MKTLFLAAALLLPLSALATNTPDPVPETPIKIDVKADAGSKAASSSRSSARSSSTSGAKSGSSSSSRSGDSKSAATSGDSTSSAETGDSSASADNAVKVTSDDDTLVEDNPVVPAQLLPMLLESGCRTGVNAAGGDRGGSGAAGVSFMTDRCWSMVSAINFIAMGEYEYACELMVDINRDQNKRIKNKPDCHAIAERILAAEKLREIKITDSSGPEFDPSLYFTKAEILERDKRQLERTTSK